ncbi:hypothetical protein FKM82_016491 [Ascaphus truei]
MCHCIHRGEYGSQSLSFSSCQVRVFINRTRGAELTRTNSRCIHVFYHTLLQNACVRSERGLEWIYRETEEYLPKTVRLCSPTKQVSTT